ncbi:MAG: type II secretion system F family protein [Rickettsiales bacterium]|nr:type II secretion system F family protein [Rickettsiales bacterium]
MALNLNLLYSKLYIRFNPSKRIAVYQKIASLLRNDFTLMNALDRVYAAESRMGAKPSEPAAIMIKDWQRNLERGQPFFAAVSDWVPASDVMMLTLGDVSKLSVALDNVVLVSSGVSRINSATISGILYPVFLLGLTALIIIGVGIYLVPPLMDAAGGDVQWRGTAATLVWVSDFAKNNWLSVLILLAALGALVWWSLRNWFGRLRVFADGLPIYRLYKISVSVSWMMSLAAMVAAGGSLTESMRMLEDNASPYLRYILRRTSGFIANGDNLGAALEHAGAKFPNEEIIGDLTIYADMNDFDKNLGKIAKDYLETSVRKMESISEIMNSTGIILVSAVIAWVVFGTFQMQEQITQILS